MKEEIEEGQIYIVHNFKVKTYVDDETNRAIRNNKHIFFTIDTRIEKDTNFGLRIPDHCFDFWPLHDVEPMKNDNRFLTGK